MDRGDDKWKPLRELLRDFAMAIRERGEGESQLSNEKEEEDEEAKEKDDKRTWQEIIAEEQEASQKKWEEITKLWEECQRLPEEEMMRLALWDVSGEEDKERTMEEKHEVPLWIDFDQVPMWIDTALKKKEKDIRGFS